MAGNDFDMGHQQGVHFCAQVPEILSSIRDIPVFHDKIQRCIPLAIYRFVLKRYGREFLAYHQAQHQQGSTLSSYQYMKGLTEGLQIPFELYYGLASLEVITSEMPHLPSLGCTTLLFGKNRTRSGQTLLAYNHDFPEPFGKHLILRRKRPLNGYASLSVTYEISTGAIAGVNEKGLALSINHAFERKVLRHQPALFVTNLLQLCLDRCANVSEAQELILSTPVTNGSMLSLIDESGAMLNIEVSSRGKALRHERENFIGTFNNYQTEEMQKLELPLDTKGSKMLRGMLVHACNIGRNRRWANIYDPSIRVDESIIREWLSDHDNRDGDIDTICRHHSSTSSTLASMMIFPESREIKLATGLACRADYQNFKLFPLS